MDVSQARKLRVLENENAKLKMLLAGRIKHAEFAMASGEMSADAFTGFLTETLAAMSRHSCDGAIAFVCMDWRQMGELLTAGHAAFTELKNLTEEQLRVLASTKID